LDRKGQKLSCEVLYFNSGKEADWNICLQLIGQTVSHDPATRESGGQVVKTPSFHCREHGEYRLLRVLWTARRSNQSILKEINPEYSLEGLMLKLQHFGHLMQRANSLEKTLLLGRIEGRRRRG